MPVVPEGVIVLWGGTDAAIPAGWERETSLDGKFVKGTGAAVDPDVTGGATTHSHTDPGHAHALASHNHGGTASGGPSGSTVVGVGFLTATSTHTHTAPTSGSTSSTSSGDAGTWQTHSNEPPFFTWIFIRSDGTPFGIPADASVFWNSATLDTGWIQHEDSKALHVKGATAAGDAGGTGGDDSHDHIANAHGHGSIVAHGHSSGASGGPSATVATNSGGGVTTSGHTHAVSLASGAAATSIGSGTAANTSDDPAEPPYHVLPIATNDTGLDKYDDADRYIAMWLGLLSAIPAGWKLCDGTSGTPDLRGKFIRAADDLSDFGDTGGAVGHSHASGGGHTHTQSHAHSQSFANDATNGGGTAGSPSAAAVQNHTHSATNSAASTTALTTADQTAPTNADTQPPFRTVAYIMFGVALVVEVDEPPGGIVPSPQYLWTWLLSFQPAGGGPVQASYRLRIFEVDMFTTILDTGVVSSVDTEHEVMPDDWDSENEHDYVLRVDVTDEDGLTGFGLMPFHTTWAPPATITGLRVTRIGNV